MTVISTTSHWMHRRSAVENMQYRTLVNWPSFPGVHDLPVVPVGRLSLALDEGADEPLPAPEEHPVAVLLGLSSQRDLDLLDGVVLALAPSGEHAALLRPA